jgi:hypothetical protein
MPFLVVTKDDPFLGADYRQPLVIFHVLSEFVRRTVMVFNVERSLHFEQRFREARAETSVKIECY